MPQVNLENSNDAIVRMKKKLGNMETEEGRRKGLQMSTRPDDLFVVTTPKAGTTWTQQVRGSISRPALSAQGRRDGGKRMVCAMHEGSERAAVGPSASEMSVCVD